MIENSDIEFCLDYVVKKEKFKSYKYDVIGGTQKVDGYLGDKIVVDLYAETDEGELRRLHLFIKSSTDNSHFRRAVPLQEIFEREIFVYNKLMKAFDDLQSEHGIDDNFPRRPKFYGYVVRNGREHIILENISPKGYKLHDRKHPMDKEHVKLVLENYAKLHALSFALKDQKPDLFRQLTKNCSDLLGKFILQTDMLPNFTIMLQKIKKVLEENGDLHALKKLEHFDKDIPYIITSLCHEERHDFAFLHGDSWNNNFMFKYEDQGGSKPIDICIVDWQLSRVGSPAVDLAHHLYACTSEEELHCLEDLLNIYYSEFAKFLKSLGSNPEKLFPKHRLMRHYKKYAKFGIVFMFILLRISLVDEDESPDLLSAAEKGNFADIYSTDIRSQDVYDLRARNVLVHAAKEDLL